MAKSNRLIVGRSNIDLTPEAYRGAKRARLLKKNWILGSAATFALCFLASSMLYVSNIPVRAQLETKLAGNIQLQAALGEYQDLNQAVEQQGATQDKLNAAAGGEINWDALIGSIENTLPPGTSVKSIGINTDGSSQSRGAAILLSFVADSPLGYADTLKSVQSAAGVSNVQIGGMKSSGENSYEFSATFDYDSTIRTNRFPSTATGGN